MISLAQKFGENLNPYYREHGLKGHSGFDYVGGYGSEIYADYDMYVYKTFAVNRHGTDGFTGIFGIVDDGIQCAEWCIGHCSEVFISENTKVKAGQLIGLEGNFGIVYSGNQQITYQMAVAGDHRGSHRHYQYRPIQRMNRTGNGMYLATTEGIYYDGGYYKIWDYNNGYNGCIDYTRPLFGRNLTVGMSGYDVFVLQRILAKEGCFSVNPTGNFGPITLTSVVSFQKKKGIQPTYGYAGSITRGFLNKYIVVPRWGATASSTLL